MTDETGAVGDAAQETSVSVVRLRRNEWIATNTDDPSIAHHAEKLTDLLAAHRHAVTFRLGKETTIRYLLGDETVAERIARLRTAGEQIAALRREASHAESAIRAERTALMRHLANLQVTPGEIAQIMHVPTTAVPKDLGTDRDARFARYLATHQQHPDDPSAAERLF